MTELQSPQRRSFTAKAIFGLLLAVVMVGAFATAASAGNTRTARSGELHVTKECSEYTGAAGSFCTITRSNLNAIQPGMKVIYFSAANFKKGVLKSDLVLTDLHHNNAFGHVKLDLTTGTGPLTLSGGTGRFRGFHAQVAVSPDPRVKDLVHWDGRYSFTRGWSFSHRPTARLGHDNKQVRNP
jgi:hypothetical protein